jgi:hypothetical protein
MTDSTEYARPVRLPRRSRQGVVMGMDPWQLTFITAAAVALLIFVNRFGRWGSSTARRSTSRSASPR